MLMKFVFLTIFMVCQTMPLDNPYEYDNKYLDVDTRSDTLTSDQLAGLDEYFARKFDDESLSENAKRSTSNLNEDSMQGSRQTRSISRYNECIRNLQSRTDLDAFDYVSELRNCHRLLKQISTDNYFYFE